MYEYDIDIVTAFSVAVKHYEGLHSCFHVNCCFILCAIVLVDSAKRESYFKRDFCERLILTGLHPKTLISYAAVNQTTFDLL